VDALEQPIRFPAASTAIKDHSLSLFIGSFFCTRKLTGLWNGRLTSSLDNIIEAAKRDVWSHWTTLNAQFVRHHM
jgi:hypothetical protein